MDGSAEGDVDGTLEGLADGFALGASVLIITYTSPGSRLTTDVPETVLSGVKSDCCNAPRRFSSVSSADCAAAMSFSVGIVPSCPL